MFQNLAGEYNEDAFEEDVEQNNKKTSKEIIKQVLTKQNIILYVLSFMISTVGFGQGIAPFGIAILASCCSNSIPMGIVYILTCIGTWIGFGKDQLLMYLLTSLIFMASVIFVRPKVTQIEQRKKLGFHLGAVCFLVQASKMLFNTFLVYELLESIVFAISACIFYKIFSSSIQVIKQWGIKKAFSVEEVIGASLILSLAIAAFRDFSILGFSIKNILSILIVLVMGWKNGVLVGATSGVTIGAVLGMMSGSDPIQLAAYAISGMLAGLLNRFGRIGVVIGFVLGNGVLAYVTNGHMDSAILFQEILIASIGLLAVPKKMKIDITDLYGKTRCFPVASNNKLEQNQEMIYKLNSVSEAISEVAQSYREAAATVVEETQEEDKNKEIFINEFKNQLSELEENMLYDDLDEDSGILDDIFEKIIKEDVMTEKDLVEIFENHNNYIIGFDDDQVGSNIKQDIRAVIKAINYSYRMSRVNFIWEKKVDENKKTMGTQLEGISKTISSIAEDITKDQKNELDENQKECMKLQELCRQKGVPVGDIKLKKEPSGKVIVTMYIDACHNDQLEECKAGIIQKILTRELKQTMLLQKEDCPIRTSKTVCTLTYSSEDKYKMQLGIAKTTKAGSSVSGDSDLEIKLQDGKFLFAISDGMGSGPEARKSSQVAIKMLKRLLSSGFDKETSVELINSSMCLNAKDDMYATLDTAILDLYKGNVEFIKNGSCPTYIKNKKNVDIVKSLSLPAGILGEIDLNVYDRDLEENDILVMCSDGILEANIEYENKDLWLKYLLEEIETDNVQKIADIILQEAIDHNYGMAKDDMTVLVIKILKKQQ